MPWIIPHFISYPGDKVGEKMFSSKEFDIFLCYMKTDRYNCIRYKRENNIGNCGKYVIFFYNEKHKNDNKKIAFKISDAITSLPAVFEYTELLTNEIPYPVYIPKHHIKNYSFSEKKVIKYYKCEYNTSLKNNILGCIIPKEDRNKIFSLLEKCLNNEKLFKSLCYFAVSAKEIFLYDEELKETLKNKDWSPDSTRERFMLENYFFNAYKAIEALVGDPGSKNKKERFKNNLQKIGIDPDVILGFDTKTTILDEIYSLNEIRDSKVGHGSVPHKEYLTYYELVRVQYLARYLIQILLK